MTIDIKSDDVVAFITNDMYGGEWTPESTSRFMTLMRARKEHRYFRLVVSGGLENRHGISIAQSIAERMHRFGIPDQEILRPFDEASSDTWTQIENIVKIFKSYSAGLSKNKVTPRLFVISDDLHLFNITRMAQTLGIKIYPIVSPLSGSVIFKLRRFLNEALRFAWSIFDPRYQHPVMQKRRERVTDEAKQKG